MDLLSPNYTLTARLQSADAQNTWKWNSVTLSTTAATITNAGAYSTTTSYTFSLTIPFAEAAGTISNTVQMTAVANRVADATEVDHRGPDILGDSRL